MLTDSVRFYRWRSCSPQLQSNTRLRQTLRCLFVYVYLSVSAFEYIVVIVCVWVFVWSRVTDHGACRFHSLTPACFTWLVMTLWAIREAQLEPMGQQAASGVSRPEGVSVTSLSCVRYPRSSSMLKGRNSEAECCGILRLHKSPTVTQGSPNHCLK